MNKYGKDTQVRAEGQVKTVGAWAKYKGVPVSTIISRLSRGANPEDAVSGNYPRIRRSPARRPVQPKVEQQKDPCSTLLAARALIDVPMSEGDKIAAISLLLEKAGY